jgi:hypothetical protein
MKATFVKSVSEFAGYAELFRLEKLKKHRYVTFRFIIVSTLDCAFDTNMPETNIFPANSKGEVLDWSELEGSFQGAVDISKALRNGGYEEIR